MAGVVVDNQRLSKSYGLLTFKEPVIAKQLKPGQFIAIRCTDGGFDPLLRRPFSPAGVKVNLGEVEVLYKVVGRGTRFLLLRKRGQPLDVIGPLGTGFYLMPEFKQVAIVGRGVGIAPLLFLSQQAASLGISVKAFFSVRHEELDLVAFLKKRLQTIVSSLYISTRDDELVTDFLRKEIDMYGPQYDMMYVCGSRRLLREIQDISKKYGIPSQVSLEAKIACGVGVCHGCVVKVRSGSSWRYAKVCTEGPVFDTQEVMLDD